MKTVQNKNKIQIFFRQTNRKYRNTGMIKLSYAEIMGHSRSWCRKLFENLTQIDNHLNICGRRLKQEYNVQSCTHWMKQVYMIHIGEYLYSASS